MRSVLITGGATRNYLDAIRFISNMASGKTGIWLLEQLPKETSIHFLWGLGVEQNLSQTKRATAHFTQEEFFSTHDLAQKMEKWVQQNPKGLILHSAAVGDFEVESVNGESREWAQIKLDSSQAMNVKLIPTKKIVDGLKKIDPDQFLISFKQLPPHTTSEEATKIGKAQWIRTLSDVVFTNVTHQLDCCQLIQGEEVKYFTKRIDALEALHKIILTTLVD